MTTKISFSVENADIVDENPNSNFAVLSLDFFASGKNLHDMYVSDETLQKTADTIKNCPVVWAYDEKLDDIYTHVPEEVPCGFIPQEAQIISKKLEDGRTMLNVTGYIWKKFTGNVLEFFRRDKVKPVSVEMSVYDMALRPDGLTELFDFKYEGITLLGTYVTPAIPMAGASVLSFSKQYQEDVKKEFASARYAGIDFTIPESVKANVKNALEQHKVKGGANSVILSVARHIVNNSLVSPDKVKYIANYMKAKKGFQPDTESELPFMLMGGKDGKVWAESVFSQMDEEDSKTFRYFESEGGTEMPYASLKDINPALKGITPPLSLAQANSIARQADAVGADKGGWGIAIKHFKDSHVVDGDHWTEKKEMSAPPEEEVFEDSEKMEMNMELLEKTEKMAEDDAAQEEKETKEEENKESPAQEEKEKEEGTEKKFGFPDRFASEMERMAAMFSADEGEEDEDVKMAAEELKKGVFADPGVVAMGLYRKMCKMGDTIAQMAEEKKAFMAENESLKKFKAESNEEEKAFAVQKTMAELDEKVVIPAEAREEMIAEAEKYTLENINAWITFAKAKSFDFAVKTPEKNGVLRVGMPFTGTTVQPKEDLWNIR